MSIIAAIRDNVPLPPVVIDNGVLIGGNHLIDVSRALGFTGIPHVGRILRGPMSAFTILINSKFL
jgi:hypothetical protein